MISLIRRILCWIGLLQCEQASAPQLPYYQREVLSRAELSFYHVLRTAVGSDVALFTKVNLGDLFGVKTKDASERQRYRNKIDRKHVDFLLCDPNQMRPLVAIELDDKSHQRKDRQARDAFVDEVFQVAGLPLVRVPAQKGYSIETVRSLLGEHLSAPTADVVPAGQVQCPKCGSAMVERTVKKGEHAGKQFWGCTNYPNCRGILAKSQ